MLTINALVIAGTVSGASSLCPNATAQYISDSDAGGSWSSSNTSVATVNSSSGVVTALAAGITNIIYTVTGPCNTSSAAQSLTVNANVSAGTVNGASPLCINATTQYSSTGDVDGTWSSSNTGVATVNPSSGVVTGVAAGTTNIIYSVGGCNPISAQQLLRV